MRYLSILIFLQDQNPEIQATKTAGVKPVNYEL